jgi:hypothetical protein
MMITALCTVKSVGLRHHLQAIEAGRLPGDILDEIPSKYYNGSVICEVSYFIRLEACYISKHVI